MTPAPVHVSLPPIASGRDLLIGASRPSSNAAAPSTKPEDGETGQHLWSTFWQEFAPENEPQERCYVPGDGRDAVDRRWADFAMLLPSGAQVIDLGCGAGIVGRTLIGCRNDLCITGVDWASVPASSEANLTIRAGIAMEALPFGNACFDGAVSLFGIEYGNIDKTAKELERVLKAGAHFGFLVHHRQSEIVREGSARRRALRALTSGKMKALFLAGSNAGFGQQRQNLRAEFPGEPMIDLVSNHFLRNFDRPRAERQAIWQKLADDLDPEIVLLAHLEQAGKSAAELASWLVPLLSAMRLVSVSVQRRSSGEPIAWRVDGIR